jgi:hypothetical protein
MAEFDFFFLWRRVLIIACYLYAAIKTAQAVMLWYRRLSGRGRYLSMARQYLLVQLLRVSPRRFAWEMLDLLILSAATLALIYAHRFV